MVVWLCLHVVLKLTLIHFQLNSIYTVGLNKTLSFSYASFAVLHVMDFAYSSLSFLITWRFELAIYESSHLEIKSN